MTIKEKLDKINPFKIYSEAKKDMDTNIQTYLDPIQYTPSGGSPTSLTSQNKQDIASSILGYSILNKSGKNKYLEGLFGNLRENDPEYVEKKRKNIITKLDTLAGPDKKKLGTKLGDTRYDSIVKSVNNSLYNDNFIEDIIEELDNKGTHFDAGDHDYFIKALNDYKTDLADIKTDIDAINGMSDKGTPLAKAFTVGAVEVGALAATVYIIHRLITGDSTAANDVITTIANNNTSIPPTPTPTTIPPIDASSSNAAAIAAQNASANATHIGNQSVNNTLTSYTQIKEPSIEIEAANAPIDIKDKVTNIVERYANGSCKATSEIKNTTFGAGPVHIKMSANC